MRIVKRFALVLWLLYVGKQAQAQPCGPINLGTKTLYATAVQKNTLLPSGYQPVFINHAGRHGARHLTKPVASSFAYNLLLRADSASGLTVDGKMLLNKLRSLDTIEQKNIKNISAEGVQEQQAIAARMYQQNKHVFSKPVEQWQATITKEIRTRQTATAFIEALQQQAGKKDSVRYVVNDTTLRFYDLAPAYVQFEKSGSWKNDFQQLKHKLKFGETIKVTIHRWLLPAFASNIAVSEQEELVSDVYGFYSILPSIQQEVKAKKIHFTADSIGRFFSCKELKLLSAIDPAEDYLSKGPGTNTSGVQVTIAAPLLADFINTIDAFIRNGNATLVLRFCHAETIAPFAALLSLAGADKAVQSINSFSSAIWDAATVVPLSANVQWILYKPASGNRYLLKCLLNERAVQINGLATKQFPYYDWQSVRAFYLKKLQQLHFLLTANGYRYLQALQ